MATTSTKIQWTDATWNFVRGCARVSPGCERCYAERTAYRFNGEGQPYEGLTVLGKHGPRWAGKAHFIADALWQPLKWRESRKIFCNSMSDIFHDDVTNEQIAAAFGVMASCPRHTFQLLTKRPQRMLEWFRWVDKAAHQVRVLHSTEASSRTQCLMAALDAERETHRLGDSGPLHVRDCGDPDGPWPLPNVWLGVSCEDQQRANERVSLLLKTPAAVRFVSAEPLLGPIDFTRIWRYESNDAWRANSLHEYRGFKNKVDWVIVGGESGPGARPCDVAWIRSIVGQCADAGTACFVKQLGTRPAWSNKFGTFTAERVGPNYLHLDGLARGPLRDRKGGEMDDWPEDLRVRQYPQPSAAKSACARE